MPVAYDANGPGQFNTSAPANLSFNHTPATSGVDVFLFILVDRQVTPSSVNYGGSAMTLVGSRNCNNNATKGILFVYRRTGVTSTSATAVTATIGSSWWAANTVSYTGVTSVGTLQVASGSSTSLSSGLITASTDQMIVSGLGAGDIQGFSNGTKASISSASGGTNRSLITNTPKANCACLAISDSTSTATFGATISVSNAWATASLLLGATTTLTPAAATITITGTAPSLVTTTVLTPAAATVTVTGTAPKLENTVSPPGGSLTGALITITGTPPTLDMTLVTTGATITITGGTPSTAGESVLTPAAATIAVTGTAPTLLLSIVMAAPTMPVTGGTPVLITTFVLSPVAATIVVTGLAPSITLPLILTAPAATITITGQAPSLTGVAPPPAPVSLLTPTQFREIEQQLHDRRHAYQSRKMPQPLIRLWDKDMKLIARITIPETWECEEIAHDNGYARIDIAGKDNDWLRELIVFKTKPAEDLHITIDPDPSKPTDYKNRWGGKIETIADVETKGKPTVTTITAVSNRIHLRHILFAAMPVLPHAVQIPKMFLWGGPCVSACASATFANLFRIYTLNGWWPIPRNMFDPYTWINNLSPLNWPVQVMPVRVLTDQSRWITIGARWQDAETVLTPAMKDAGVICHAYTWLPGDPAPYEAFGNLKEQLKPTRACVILSFEDQSGVSGPTGTAADGLINLFAVTLDDIFGETLLSVDGDGDGETDPFFRKILGVAPKRPPFVYRDTGYGGVIGRTTVVHKTKAITIVVGGRSPGWVNQAISFGIRYGLSQIAQAFSSIPGAPAQITGSEGLDNLYQGNLDDCVSWDTLIDCPTGQFTIKELADTSKPFQVWSITPSGERVAATAVLAFKKGTAELLRYTLSDGRSIKATRDHRFLTSKGFLRGSDVGIGTMMATVDHAKLSRSTDLPAQLVQDSDYDDIAETDALTFREVVDIEPVGVEDFYDMHVPGWENYSANGFWNHNTLLAFMPFVDPKRSAATGIYARNEHFEQGTGFTISSLMTARQGWWKTRPYTSMKFDIDDSLFKIGEDIRLGSRVSAERKGVVYTDQIMAIKRRGDRNSSGRPMISFGDDSREEDPVAQGFAAISNIANFAAMIVGSGDMF